MPSEKTYRLTGGIFFLLISKCLKNTGKTEVDCLSELVAIFDGGDKFVSRKTMRSNTTQYKKCELDNSLFLPFGNKDLQEVFRNRLEQDYASVLAEVSSFTKKFISSKDYSWLVSAIVDILRYDSSAAETQFRIRSNGKAVSYQELLSLDYVKIEPFLTGIWGFILTERPYNTVGAETFRALTIEPETKGNPRLFVSNIGKSQKIRVDTMNRDSKNVSLSSYTHHFEMDKIAREISLGFNRFVNESEIKNEEAEYFKRLKKSYNIITTLLYAETPQPFYDFYICNAIYRVEAGRKRHRIPIENVTIEALIEHSNYVLLSGNGGLGKSMMMRHLLLDCVNRYEEVGLLPIFLELRSYAETNESLADYAYREFTNFGGEKSRTDFDKLLESGDILLLCDGLDEVQSDSRRRFQQELEGFANSFPDSVIVISSRPFGPFSSYASMRRFMVFNLMPFSEGQALALVQKLKFHEDQPAIKQNFMKALKSRLYWSHHSFAENPLLLTIMMMMYAEIGDVPSKMHLFYNEAFEVLARKHDATKGGYKRPLATNLDVETFKEVFSEFCARTYIVEKVELTDEEMETHYNKLKVPHDGKSNWTYESFAKDLTSNLCLMYYESLKYHFVHRSFQEYFCARYLSKRLDKNLYTLAKAFFEGKHSRYYSDSTFDMLYDMIPERVEENVFIPYLQEFFTECDCGDGYKTFLRTMYSEIVYNIGETASEYETDANSTLYKFIVKTANINFSIDDSDFPYDPEFVFEKYVKLDEEYESSSDNIVRQGDVPWDYYSDYDPEEVGYNLAFDTEKILDDPGAYPEFAKRLFDEDFALKKEYNAVREYFNDLKKRHSQPHKDVFSLL